MPLNNPALRSGDERFGGANEPLTEFEKTLLRRVLSNPLEFPEDFWEAIRGHLELVPPRILASDIERLTQFMVTNPAVQVVDAISDADAFPGAIAKIRYDDGEADADYVLMMYDDTDSRWVSTTTQTAAFQGGYTSSGSGPAANTWTNFAYQDGQGTARPSYVALANEAPWAVGLKWQGKIHAGNQAGSGCTTDFRLIVQYADDADTSWTAFNAFATTDSWTASGTQDGAIRGEWEDMAAQSSNSGDALAFVVPQFRTTCTNSGQYYFATAHFRLVSQ